MDRREENEWLQEEAEKTKLESVSRTAFDYCISSNVGSVECFAAARLPDVCLPESQEA